MGFRGLGGFRGFTELREFYGVKGCSLQGGPNIDLPRNLSVFCSGKQIFRV